MLDPSEFWWDRLSSLSSFLVCFSETTGWKACPTYSQITIVDKIKVLDRQALFTYCSHLYIYR
jgi:hypothetical protein